MSFPIGIGFWKQKGGVCPSYSPGLYTDQELNDMIFANGWIPVASGGEIDLIASSSSETMGVGTCWEATYTTGPDKNYVFVKGFDFTGDQPLGNITIQGIIDGNELLLSNYSQVQGLFYLDGGTVRNFRAGGIVDSTGGAGDIRGFLVNLTTGGLIDNCQITADVINEGRCGMICGGSNVTLLTELQIKNSISIGTVQNVNSTSGQNGVAGIVGNVVGSSNSKVHLYDNVNYASCTSQRDNVGGISGRIDYGVIKRNANYGEITAGRFYAGGCFGLLFDNNEVEDCYSIADVNGRNSAGFAAYIRNSTTVTNCYSAGAVNGSGVSGFVDIVLTGSSVTNSYWDTTLGPASSTAGTGKTTSELQTPTSNTGIYSAWSPTVWDFGTSSEYPILINTP